MSLRGCRNSGARAETLGGVPESSLLLSFEKQGAASDSRTQEFLFLFGQKQIYFHRLKVRNNFIPFGSYLQLNPHHQMTTKQREYVKFNCIIRVWSQCTCGLEASLVAWINHGCNQRGAAVSGSLQTPGTALLWEKPSAPVKLLRSSAVAPPQRCSVSNPETNDAAGGKKSLHFPSPYVLGMWNGMELMWCRQAFFHSAHP